MTRAHNECQYMAGVPSKAETASDGNVFQNDRRKLNVLENQAEFVRDDDSSVASNSSVSNIKPPSGWKRPTDIADRNPLVNSLTSQYSRKAVEPRKVSSSRILEPRGAPRTPSSHAEGDSVESVQPILVRRLQEISNLNLAGTASNQLEPDESKKTRSVGEIIPLLSTSPVSFREYPAPTVPSIGSFSRSAALETQNLLRAGKSLRKILQNKVSEFEHVSAIPVTVPLDFYRGDLATGSFSDSLLRQIHERSVLAAQKMRHDLQLTEVKNLKGRLERELINARQVLALKTNSSKSLRAYKHRTEVANEELRKSTSLRASFQSAQDASESSALKADLVNQKITSTYSTKQILMKSQWETFSTRQESIRSSDRPCSLKDQIHAFSKRNDVYVGFTKQANLLVIYKNLCLTVDLNTNDRKLDLRSPGQQSSVFLHYEAYLGRRWANLSIPAILWVWKRYFFIEGMLLLMGERGTYTFTGPKTSDFSSDSETPRDAEKVVTDVSFFLYGETGEVKLRLENDTIVIVECPSSIPRELKILANLDLHHSSPIS